MQRAGVTPDLHQIRGGTDGARLSFMGLPTPNLFAGEQNLHSRLEWVSVQDMDKAVEVIVQICRELGGVNCASVPRRFVSWPYCTRHGDSSFQLFSACRAQSLVCVVWQLMHGLGIL